MEIIKDLDIVALTEDLEATHFETKQMIKLFKGQVGTMISFPVASELILHEIRRRQCNRN